MVKSPTRDEIISSLLNVADNLYRALQVHDAITAEDYNQEIEEIEQQYRQVEN